VSHGIRRATSADAGPIAELWTEAYVTLGVGGRTESYTAADYVASASNGEVFVVDGPSGIAGAVALCGPSAPRRVVAIAAEAELSRLAVASPARRQGIGRALVDLCERRARDAGWEAIALWSRPLQTEAHRLYQSVGYRRLPERDSVDAAGQERLAFRLALGPTETIAR
jgi:ribosomal protein S18 acetylase RimI-like enzyme